MREVQRIIGVYLHKRPREVHACQDAAYDIEDQSERVDDEDRRDSLLGFGEKEKHDEESNAGTNLGPENDGDLTAVKGEVVQLCHVNGVRHTIAHMDVETLVEWIRRCGIFHD